MSPKRYNVNNDNDTAVTKVVLIVFFVFITFILTAYFVAAWHIDRHERNMHSDPEAQALLQSSDHGKYSALLLSSTHEANFQDANVLEEANIRRMVKRERIRDQIRNHISGVYEISMTRMDDAVLSDDSNSEFDVEAVDQGKCQGELEEDDESSENDFESIDDSDDNSVEVMEMRGLLSITRPAPR